jgi:hypothetical protein
VTHPPVTSAGYNGVDMSDPRTHDQPWQDFDLVQRAAAYAAQAHRADVRKGTTIPYLSHLWAVAALVLEHGGDDTQVTAALLHDVVEDHGGLRRLAEVRAHFGDEVARLVEGLSDSVTDTTDGTAKPPWKERKTQYLAHLAQSDARTQLVSACDKLHNARCLLTDLRADGHDVWTRFNEPDPGEHVWYYRRLVAIFEGADIPRPLIDELDRTVDAVTALAVLADCPRCGRPGVPILYGLPSPEMAEADERGEIALGGCVIEDDQPTHECPSGHRWLEPSG